MSVGYTLVNIDKGQKISFYSVNTGTKLNELSGTIISSSIVTYYLLTNPGDQIGFINDTFDKFNICGKVYDRKYFESFIDVTSQIISDLIENQIFRDDGIIWVDKEDNLSYRDLTNVWDPKAQG
jgi:hypothetical protein